MTRPAASRSAAPSTRIASRSSARVATARGCARGPRRPLRRPVDPRPHRDARRRAAHPARARRHPGRRRPCPRGRDRALLGEIAGRLRYLVDVGLEYLALDRGSDTLSGGEHQRARLAAQLGSGLVGVAYVLDEPTAGLHPRDTARLIASLRRLQELGNSVLVVEHDEAVIRAADWVVDLGPGAGPDGGLVVAAGPPDRLAAADSGSVTAQYLARGPAPRRRTTRAAGSPPAPAGSRSEAPPSTTSGMSTPAYRWVP